MDYIQLLNFIGVGLYLISIALVADLAEHLTKDNNKPIFLFIMAYVFLLSAFLGGVAKLTQFIYT